METYDVIYILGNLFMAYVIYKFMHIFYSVSKVAPLIEKIAYIGYFLCITVTHVFLKVPTIIMVANLILFFLLAFLYEGSFKKKVIAVFSIYFPLLLVETTFALLTSYLRPDPLQPFSYESEFGLIAIRIASLVLVLIIQGFKNIKNAVPIPNVYWASLLAVPLGTLIMLYSIFMCENISRTLIIVCLVCALGINLLTFYLYDRLSALLEEQMNSRLERIQIFE